LATRKRAPSRSTAGTRTRRRTSSGITKQFTPEVVRSIVGITLLVLGAMTLIALLPASGKGALTSWWTNVFAPWFGSMRWLFPFLLLGAGAYLEWRRPRGWGLTLLGLAIAYAGILGIAQVLFASPSFAGGGRIGRFLASILQPLLTAPGALVILVAMVVVGLMLAFNLRLHEIVQPFVRFGTWLKVTVAASLHHDPGTADPKAPPKPAATKPNAKSPVGLPIEPAGGQAVSILDEPAMPALSQAPISRTFVTGDGLAASASGVAVATRTAVADDADDGLASIEWILPPVDLLEAARPSQNGAGVDHEANIRRIEEKLLHFGIPAKVVGKNAGPVVTQYEVRPDKGVKLSRIEALSDDLAMALAARSIRIEAPIPGKDLVGIEIPNTVSEVVAFRPLVEESNMLATSSPLSFALGRDVSGKAMAVDLAKMPHLLIAGATGSGKSVCVNAVITSLLMHAKPDEVRLVLVDLKRVELAPYDRLPHLLQHVIVEPNEAKAILNWAVHEMEDRYKALASRSVRNIEAFNALPEATRGQRLPYIVLIIDELADLIMREGRKVEDPVVKIAQKARAVGIHLVLATQRPSVNVVTGLIKANVPSRIAFAMASMVDSRTVLDSPGAEDLIGRGDMLYQPVDLPRPARLQGVFVSDAEVSAITSHWLEQTDGRTFYEEAILEFSDGEGNGSGEFAWLSALDVDEMTPHAAELVMREQKASTSRLQTKLKLGFSRASRVMDELERYGIVGPQDPRNPASPRAIYGPENWLRSTADVDRDD
jgi:DNA segregation ATPase FtsK/SpoIIIE, S-DNA-T family